jgi:hypothetical protein
MMNVKLPRRKALHLAAGTAAFSASSRMRERAAIDRDDAEGYVSA